jgi:hypothetical protein
MQFDAFVLFLAGDRYVFDGDSFSSTSEAEIIASGSTAPATHTAAGTDLIVVFDTDGSALGNGWRASASCTTSSSSPSPTPSPTCDNCEFHQFTPSRGCTGLCSNCGSCGLGRINNLDYCYCGDGQGQCNSACPKYVASSSSSSSRRRSSSQPPPSPAPYQAPLRRGDDDTHDGLSSMGVFLIIVLVIIVICGVVVHVVMKKKHKQKKTDADAAAAA